MYILDTVIKKTIVSGCIMVNTRFYPSMLKWINEILCMKVFGKHNILDSVIKKRLLYGWKYIIKHAQRMLKAV